jgi:hypothetical protein
MGARLVIVSHGDKPIAFSDLRESIGQWELKRAYGWMLTPSTNKCSPAGQMYGKGKTEAAKAAALREPKVWRWQSAKMCPPQIF